MKSKLLIISFLLFSFGINSQKENSNISFSHQSGVYKSTINIELKSLDSNTKIYYTLDGSIPSKRNKKYFKKINISSSSTLRVIGYLNSKKTDVFTRNFVISDRKFTLPFVFISMNNSDLYDEEKGIYVKGLNAAEEQPYKGANFHKNWERVINIEYLDSSGKSGFNQVAGIKIAGQYSTILPQKSFAIIARKKYGNKRFKYPIFKNRDFKKYKSFVLRNSGSDNNNSHFRDILMTSLVKNLNFDVQDYNSCIVYINGNYWGIYHIREKINEHFLKQHYGVKKDSIAILKHKYDVQHYGRINYRDILKYLKKTKFKDKKEIDSLSKLIDIDNYLDYNISQVYFNNIDAGGNIRYWRHRKKGSKWRWIMFDTDFGFHLRKENGYKDNSLDKFTKYNKQKWPIPPFSTLIIRKLLENDSIRNIYVQKTTYYLNTIFDSTVVLKRINEIENSLKPEMPFHLKKWKRSVSKWEEKVEIVKTFAKNRPEYMREHMKEKFNFDTTFTIEINFSKHGEVYFDTYKIDSGYRGVYFSPKKYKIKAAPSFGYYFSKWQGDLNSDKPINEITLDKSSKFTPIFLLKPKSEFYKKVIINEVSAHDSLLSDYIEIYNSSEKDIDISGWIIQKNNTLNYKIKENITLKKGGYYTVFKDSTSLNNTITNSEIGVFNIKKNTLLKLYSSKEELVDSLQLSKKLFNKKDLIEFEKNAFNEGWIASQKQSINKENVNQKEAKKQLKYLIYGTIIFLSLILLIWLFFRLIKRKKEI